MATSEKELSDKAERVQKLREQVAAAEATRIEREADVANDIAYAQLDAEEVRLQAQLDQAKRQSRVGDVRAGAATVLDVVKDDKDNATAYAKAAAAAAEAASAASSSKSSDNDNAGRPVEVPVAGSADDNQAKG